MAAAANSCRRHRCATAAAIAATATAAAHSCVRSHGLRFVTWAARGSLSQMIAHHPVVVKKARVHFGEHSLLRVEATAKGKQLKG